MNLRLWSRSVPIHWHYMTDAHLRQTGIVEARQPTFKAENQPSIRVMTWIQYPCPPSDSNP